MPTTRTGRVSAVRRSTGVSEAEAAMPLLTATQAGEACPLFPKGGEGFGAWCVERGIPAKERRRSNEWDDLLLDFASRPIHGYRRGPHGGSHEYGRR